jgi:DMSO/TMAO reductase YedYZ molybdopterin-dependent catalytic subunit
MSKLPEELARRTPPGQVLTTKWPVLTYGLTPRFDPREWTFHCFGLVPPNRFENYLLCPP